MVRDPERLKAKHERLSLVQGDVMDRATVDRAVREQEAVLCALGHRRWLGPSKILSGGTRNIVEAMKEAGVKRLVVETALGVGNSTGRLGLYYTFFTIPLILPFYWYDKGRQEHVVRESGLDWVIVRPGQLTGGRKRGKYRHGTHVGNFIWSVSISCADVAGFMLDQIGETPYLRKAPGVCY